jgi:hypothetical protein
VSNVELVCDLVLERVTIFLQHSLTGSNESLLNISSKREGGKLLHFDVIGSAIHHKEQETALGEMILARLQAGVTPILKFLILRLQDNDMGSEDLMLCPRCYFALEFSFACSVWMSLRE